LRQMIAFLGRRGHSWKYWQAERQASE